MDDAPTGPVTIPVDHRLEQPSIANQVVAALAPTARPGPRHGGPARRLRFLLIVLFAGAIVSLGIVFRPGGPVLGVHDAALDTRSGDCLTWPDGLPERASVVDCADDHLFEVTEPVDVDGISEQPGVDTARQVEQTFEQVCPRAASRHLDGRLDPGGRFVVGMLWSPSGPPSQAGGRLVCGLQLRDDGNASRPFHGRIADQDQSDVWPSGTCLGIEDGRATDIPVDCAVAHAMEVIGTADLADAFDDGSPSVAAQDFAVRDICTTKTVDYLAPRSLAETTLSLQYTPITPAGWDAGSQSIACRLASMKPDGSWAPLVGTARSGVLIDGVTPTPVVEISPPAASPASATGAEALPASDPQDVAVPQVVPQTEPLPVEEPLPGVVTSKSPAVPGPLPGPPPG